MTEWGEIVPGYKIAKLARKTFDRAKKKTAELKDFYSSNEESVETIKKALPIEADVKFDSRNAKNLADIAHQSQWGGVSVTREDLHHLVPEED